VTNPIASALAKLARGSEHHTALGRAADAYRTSSPFRVVRDQDPETYEHRTYAIPTAQPPPEIALLAGDCAHNLRAALDHAVFGLSEAHLGRRLTADEQRRPEFPVLDYEGRWASAATQKLCWLPPEAVSIILEVQPFRFGNAEAVRYDPLLLLAELDNVDKHRVLPVVTGFTQVTGAGISDRASGRHRFSSAIAEDGSFVSRLPADLDPSTDAHPMWEVHLSVAIQEWPEVEDIDESLGIITGRVEYIVRRLGLTVSGG
jgi:hypothetical protein